MSEIISPDIEKGTNLISVKDLGKTIGEKLLFSDITFGINQGEKIAVVGANGCGKTSLMKMLASAMEPDHGEISYNNELRMAYLPQIPDFDPEATILEHILSGESPLLQTIKAYELCASRLSHAASTNDSNYERLHQELEELTHRMDEIGGWTYEHSISAILQQLGIHDLEQPMKTLSGGMKKKVELGKALLGMSNCIILDEPTNHLDLDTIEWLQEFLISTKSAVILITHDRYFLDNVCGKILEIEDNTLYTYQGNYSVFMDKKAERLENRKREQKRIGSVLRQELDWLKRGPKARSSKDKKRIERVYNLMDSQDSQKASAMEFSVTNKRLGKKILEIKNIKKAYGDNRLIDTFSYSVKKGIRIGVVGPNGCGKTTFLKMIQGLEQPDDGRIDVGINTRFGYFDQLSEELNPEQTVMGYLKEYAEEIKRSNGEYANIKNLLEEFHFPPGQHHTKLKNLSGGERRRLFLLKVLLPAPNFLLFDEPTNDLDIQTLSLLENFLDKYDGCVMTVSHDRYFLDRTVDFLCIFDGKGKVTGYPGSYSEYALYKKEEQRKLLQSKQKEKPDTRVRHNKDTQKLTFNEQREFEELLPEIEKLETEKIELEDFFQNPDPAKLADMQSRYDKICAEIEKKTIRWDELSERT